MKTFRAGAMIRGQIIDQDPVKFGGRSQGIEFLSPDPARLLPRLPLGSSTRMQDLQELAFADILDYLHSLGAMLRLSDNPYLQEALEVSCLTSGQTRPLLTAAYESLPQWFDLEKWVPTTLADGRQVSIRAFGSRALHIIAGNSPLIAGLSIVRNAVTRSDAIIKSPSNDPFTALAIARTMVEMAPDHPITRHLSVAYWKGGDEAFEKTLYQPQHLEKIVAWGGFASVKHVTRYIQPGLELISLDPKRSISIIGREALKDDATQNDVARRLAADIGSLNQEGCVNARVVYVISGTDEDGLRALNAFGRRVYDALLALPEAVSTKPRFFDRDLKANLEAAGLNDEWYQVFGGDDEEGAIIVSQLPEPVSFASRLASRVANLVPVDEVEAVFDAVDAYTQTVGIYPEALKTSLRDRLPLHGAQRLTSLGYAASAAIAAPQDAIEPLRRMCKWIVDETCDPKTVKPIWE
jgi:hypothetical protein